MTPPQRVLLGIKKEKELRDSEKKSAEIWVLEG